MAKNSTNEVSMHIQGTREAILEQRGLGNHKSLLLEQTITEAITRIREAAHDDYTSVSIPYPDEIQNVKPGRTSLQTPNEVKKFARAFKARLQKLFPKDPYNLVLVNDPHGHNKVFGKPVYGATIHWAAPRKTELRRNQRRRAAGK